MAKIPLSKDELEKALKTTSVPKLAKKLGCSDVALYKACKRLKVNKRDARRKNEIQNPQDNC